MKKLMCSLAAVMSVALGSGTLAAAEDGLQKGANIFIGTVVSDPSLKDRYIAVAGGKDRWRFRTDRIQRDDMATECLSPEGG
jgi:hypothetical protein